MKHEAVFYIADRALNEMMEKLDMRHPSKQFISLLPVNFTTASEVNKKYFMKIIAESKKEKNYWIPAISYMGNFFVDESVKIISDGKQEFFINKN